MSCARHAFKSLVMQHLSLTFLHIEGFSFLNAALSKIAYSNSINRLVLIRYSTLENVTLDEVPRKFFLKAKSWRFMCLTKHAPLLTAA